MTQNESQTPRLRVDPLGLPEAQADELRQLLSRPSVGGMVLLRRDPRRRGFWELNAGDRTFYFAVCPSGRILLLAVWANRFAPTHAAAGPALETVA